MTQVPKDGWRQRVPALHLNSLSVGFKSPLPPLYFLLIVPLFWDVRSHLISRDTQWYYPRHLMSALSGNRINSRYYVILFIYFLNPFRLTYIQIKGSWITGIFFTSLITETKEGNCWILCRKKDTTEVKFGCFAIDKIYFLSVYICAYRLPFADVCRSII